VRLRFEFTKTDDIVSAVRRTFQYAGRAIVISTVILTFGFTPFAASNYFSVRIFGTLLPFALVTALAADLFLVPALVKVGLIRYRRKSKIPEQNPASGG
jgi:hypothetical protein